MEQTSNETPCTKDESVNVNDVDQENMNGTQNSSNDQTIDLESNEDGDNSRQRSFVWDHFTKLIRIKKTKCNYCDKMLASSSSTTTLGNHLKLRCKKSPIYMKEEMKNQTILGFKQPSVTESTASLATHTFNQENCRKLLAKMCIKDNRPFSVAEDEGLREFAWELNPKFSFPSRWTVARDCLAVFGEEKKKLNQRLKDQTVSLTTDTWTSVQNYNYMSLTAHWVDEDWILRKKIINFCPIENHKGETIGKLVYRCLEGWGIDKVFTITVDNASSNDGAITYLKRVLKGPHSVLDYKYLHVRCNAHILNLVVKEGLGEQNKSISRIRNVIRYIRASPSRFQKFKQSVDKAEISCKKKPCLDVDTRWNSTFFMLETALEYKEAFEWLPHVDVNYRSTFQDEVADIEKSDDIVSKKRKTSDRVLGAPDEDDWENVRLFVEVLRIFFNATKKISGSEYVTATLLFAQLCKVHSSIRKMSTSVIETESKMGLSMQTKYDKYWDIKNINFLLYVAVVLDPRDKLTYLEYRLQLIHGKGSEKISEIKTEVEKTLRELFSHYKMKLDKSKERKGTSTTCVVEDDDDDDDDDVAGYNRFVAENEGAGAENNEVDVYLRDGKEKKIKGDDTFDVLGWWKLNTVKFPILSLIARHVLGIPISTVASESAFSVGGRVIDKHRSSLTSTMAEALICAQDWLRRTPADLQEDYLMHNQQLENVVDNLEELEYDVNVKKAKQHHFTIEEDED